MKLLLYCTKGKPYLNNCKLTNHNKRYFISSTGLWSVNPSTQQIYSTNLNGKVVAECDFEVEEFDFNSFLSYKDDVEKYNTEVRKLNEICKKSCLSATEMVSYLDTKALAAKNPNGMIGYAIHIKNLHIFDKPRPTKWYGYTDKKGYLCMVEKAPQNMMYCYDEFGNDYVLISMHPEGLCKIFNGEKTTIERKKVLKEMLWKTNQ